MSGSNNDRCLCGPVLSNSEHALTPLMNYEQHDSQWDHHDFPSRFAGDESGGDYFDYSRALTHICSLLNVHCHPPKATRWQVEVGSLQKTVRGCAVGGMEDKTATLSIRRCQNQSHVRVLDDAGDARPLNCHTEIRLSFSNGVRARKQRDGEWASLFVKAKSASITKRMGGTQGEDEQQRPSYRHILIPRICIG